MMPAEEYDAGTQGRLPGLTVTRHTCPLCCTYAVAALPGQGLAFTFTGMVPRLTRLQSPP